ncbi:MAG: ABC transporter permease [Actinobacteria bacterium]|nr:ABC transporter permease [Actinomycetota bacterium]
MDRRWRNAAGRIVASSLAPLIAVVGALLVGAVLLLAFGADPVEGYRALFVSAFGSEQALASTAIKAVPLVLVGVGITIAFRANVINIGGEGQLVAGGLLATVMALALPDLPAPVLLPLVLLAGAVGGAIWGGIPGALKAYLGVNEILSTIMLNIVAVQVMNFLLRGPLLDTSQISGLSRVPQTERLSPNADLPILIEGTRLHAGIIVALLAAVVVWVLLWRTTAGFRLRAVGLSPDAAAYAGMPVKRTVMLALALAGALAGLGGAVLVFGSVSHRMVTDGTTTGFTGAAGFNGIVAALFGGLHPLWTVLSSFVFGGLLVGGIAVQRVVQVPSSLIVALNGLVVVFVVSSELLRRRMRARALVPALRDPRPPRAPPAGGGRRPGTDRGSG